MPTFDRNQGVVRRADASVAVAELERDATAREIDVRVARALALALLRDRVDALGLFDAEVGARAPELLRMAEASYVEGASSVFEWLDALRAWREIQLTRVGLLEEQAAADVEVGVAVRAPAGRRAAGGPGRT